MHHARGAVQIPPRKDWRIFPHEFLARGPVAGILRAAAMMAQVEVDHVDTAAQKLGLQGTPLYLIGDLMVPGAPDDLYDQFVAKVAEIREKGCKATC